jgi:hypothetical protein
MSLPTASPPRAIESRITCRLQGGASASIYVGSAALIAGEGVLWHLYFMSQFPVFAWVFSTLNAAVLIWLWIGYRAASQPRIVLGPDGIDVSVGRRKPLLIPWSNVDRVEPTTWRTTPDSTIVRDYINASSPFEPNILITLRLATEVRYAIGIGKAVRTVGVRVDAVDEVMALSARLAGERAAR